MTKLLIAVKSCQKHLEGGYHDAIRTTWGQDAKALGVETRFFYGGDALFKHESDEIQLACPDDYNGLPKKTREICLWAIGKAVSHIFLCDTDTFLVPRLMLESGFHLADYAGRFNGNTDKQITNYHAISRDGRVESHARCWPWASGGYGYFLSRRAWLEVANSTPTSWAEDLWVGQVLGPIAAAGKTIILDTTEQQYSKHFPAHEYKSGYDLKFNWMEAMYGSQK